MARPRLQRQEADARTRTGDPFITSEVLYQLSYVGAGDMVAEAVGDAAERRGAGTVALQLDAWCHFVGVAAAPAPSASDSLDATRRARELAALADGETVDVLVVGGGIVGRLGARSTPPRAA